VTILQSDLISFLRGEIIAARFGVRVLGLHFAYSCEPFFAVKCFA
jgi:hypothetical protein